MISFNVFFIKRFWLSDWLRNQSRVFLSSVSRRLFSLVKLPAFAVKFSTTTWKMFTPKWLEFLFHLCLATVAHHFSDIFRFDVLLLVLLVNPLDFFLLLLLFRLYIRLFFFINDIFVTWGLYFLNLDRNDRTLAYIWLSWLSLLFWTLWFWCSWFHTRLQQMRIHSSLSFFLFPPFCLSFIALFTQFVHTLNKVTESLLLLWKLFLNSLESFSELVVLFIFRVVF